MKNNNILIGILITIIILLTTIIIPLTQNISKKENNLQIQKNNNIEKNNPIPKTTQLEIGYENIVYIEEGKAYIIPILHTEPTEELQNYYYQKHEIENIDNTVKKAFLFNLGLDPSETTYFVMEDGSVKELIASRNINTITFSTKEIIDASKKVTKIIKEDYTIYAITQDLKKLEITKSSV